MDARARAERLMSRIQNDITGLLEIFTGIHKTVPPIVLKAIGNNINKVLEPHGVSCKSVEGPLLPFDAESIEEVQGRNRGYNSPVQWKSSGRKNIPGIGEKGLPDEYGDYPQPRVLFGHHLNQPLITNIFSSRNSRKRLRAGGGKRRTTRRRH